MSPCCCNHDRVLLRTCSPKWPPSKVLSGSCREGRLHLCVPALQPPERSEPQPQLAVEVLQEQQDDVPQEQQDEHEQEQEPPKAF